MLNTRKPATQRRLRPRSPVTSKPLQHGRSRFRRKRIQGPGVSHIGEVEGKASNYRHPRVHHHHKSSVVIRKLDFRTAPVAEESARLDDRLHDDRVEGPCRDLDYFLAEYVDDDRISALTEVSVQGVGLSDFEGK